MTYQHLFMLNSVINQFIKDDLNAKNKLKIVRLSRQIQPHIQDFQESVDFDLQNPEDHEDELNDLLNENVDITIPTLQTEWFSDDIDFQTLAQLDQLFDLK